MPSSIPRTVLNLAPDARFSRHSEGDFLRLRDGGILFAYTRFFDNQRDNAPLRHRGHHIP